MPERGTEMHGLLLVDKPEGLTSAAVVAAVKRTLRQRKVGHLGTLDPFATGLLPVCIGEGTKIATFLADDEKRYVGEIELGTATDTLDRTGAVVEERPVPHLRPRDIATAVAGLRGDIMQTPPMYSALKRGGVPLHRLARAGRTVERAPRPLRITAFDVAQLAPDRLAFAVTCSRGTYVRVLAQDLGRALGTVAHLASLRRTACGPFEVRDAVTLADLERRAAEGRLPLVTPAAALGALPAVEIDSRTIAAIRRGQQWALEALGAPREAGEAVRLASARGELVAVATATADGSRWQLARVMTERADRGSE
ncbi:MAG: tRNA pseudouridine(55) synthase TruB [Polyangiaceae bacterium UTPRO1]|nr:tRNA pseudouridine(55) synthase TruB [Myxococcales bacterium]OQY64660.1 MAG: tRNA pseudouridine(55) synthase TruB [Polyangiaceae bacterium UTPRO1]